MCEDCGCGNEDHSITCKYSSRTDGGAVASNDGVRCVGIDNKQHICDPTKDVTSCGIAIRRKKLRPNDHKLYSCYECTY
jgi:hypothetical protein